MIANARPSRHAVHPPPSASTRRGGKPQKPALTECRRNWYTRPSSAIIGDDKDEKRQRAVISAFAKSAGYKIVDWYCDPAAASPAGSREACFTLWGGRS